MFLVVKVRIAKVKPRKLIGKKAQVRDGFKKWNEGKKSLHLPGVQSLERQPRGDEKLAEPQVCAQSGREMLR